ncbi:MAG TPA: hypothetical protein PLN19_08925 [Methanothrix sp.]|nr:hypothetical protein [Methanothrix sp.]HQI68888.1 hypothetical protein [Methanothrix sp.]
MSAPWTEPARPRQTGGARQPCGRAAVASPTCASAGMRNQSRCLFH